MNKPNPAPEPTMEEILASIRRIISDGDEATPAPAVDAGGAEPADVAEIPEEIAEEPSPPVAEESAHSAEADADIFDLTEDMVADDPEPVVEEPVEDEPVAAADADEPDASEDIDLDDIDKIMAGEMAVGGEADDFDSIAEPLVEPEKVELDFDEPDVAVASASPVPEPAAAAEPADPEPVVAQKPEPLPRNAAMSGLLSPQSDAVVASAFDRLANTILTQDPRTLEDLVGDMLRPMLKDWLDDNLPALVEKLVREEIERVSRGRR